MFLNKEGILDIEIGEITDIYDISGGDIANEILPYLDFEVIKNSGKRFWGYSDLTTVINAIYEKTGKNRSDSLCTSVLGSYSAR